MCKRNRLSLINPITVCSDIIKSSGNTSFHDDIWYPRYVIHTMFFLFVFIQSPWKNFNIGHNFCVDSKYKCYSASSRDIVLTCVRRSCVALEFFLNVSLNLANSVSKIFVTRMHSSRMHIARTLPCRGSPWTEIHLDRGPLDRYPMDTETPWTETPGQRPPGQRPPGQRLPLDRDPLDRD